MSTPNPATARANFNRWMDSIAFTAAENDRREVAAADEQTVPASLSEWFEASSANEDRREESPGDYPG